MATSQNTDRPVIVYDGACGFCRKQVARIRRWDTSRRFEYLPRQEPDIETRFPVLASSDFNTGLRLIEADGTVCIGADAMYSIARRLPRVSWLTWLYRIPPIRWLARRVYAWVAANRYRLSGACETGECSISPGDERANDGSRGKP